MSSPSTPRSGGTYASPPSAPQDRPLPFVQYDTLQRPISTSRYRPRRGSTASSISSIGGMLDTSLPDQGPVTSEAGHNAISILLQAPIVRTGLVPHTSAPASSAHKPPSTKDIPPVALTNIPQVNPAEFKPYLSQIGTLYDAFQRAKGNEDDGGTQLFRRDREAEKTEVLAELLEKSLRKQESTGSARSGSISGLANSMAESPRSRMRLSGALGKRGPHAVTPLSTIPSVYFEQDFRLENPRTFDVVSERSDVVRPRRSTTSEKKGSDDPPAFFGTSGRKALATNAILQEKLSWYMDTIEVHLISSISSASTSFFAALGSLRELHSEAADSVKRIRALRGDLGRLDKEMAVGGLKIVSMKQRRENLRKLRGSVEQLRQVMDGVGRCEGFLENGEIEKAIDTLDGLERLTAGESNASLGTDKIATLDQRGELVDLRKVKALGGVINDLDLLRLQIGRAFEGRFLDALLGDLRRHAESVPHHDTLKRWGVASQRARGDHARQPSTLPIYLSLGRSLRSDILSSLNGLAHSHYTLQASTAYREAVLREIKTLVRRRLPSSNDDDNESVMSASTHGGRQLSQQEKSSILARNLRNLTPDAAEELIVSIYSGVGETLRRLSVQVKVLLDITSGIRSPPISAGARVPLKSPPIATLNGYLDGPTAPSPSSESIQEEMHQVLDLSSLLGQAVDIAQTQITKILKVRSEQTSQLPLMRFLRYFTINRLFADECEAVSGRGGTALKNLVNSQIKDFALYMADQEKQRLMQSMETDVWNAKDFSAEDDRLLSHVLQGSTMDADAWGKGSRVWEELEEGSPEGINGGETASINATGVRGGTQTAVVDEQKFILPESAMAVLRGVEKLESFIALIPSMNQEVSSGLLDYLKLFNSRSCQLILGAGATRSAGLKNITTKHLALASQALSFIIALIPYIREFVRRHYSPSAPAVSGLMAEFDRVKRLYQEHQSGIHDKLVEIMSGRATTHVNAMKKVQWEQQSSDVNLYMETLTKETSTLHRVLSKHLPDTTVSTIMDPVFASYRDQWGNAFREVQPSTEAGKKRMLRDAEHFRARLSKLDGAGDIGDMIVGIVEQKLIERIEDVEPDAMGGRPIEEIVNTNGNENPREEKVSLANDTAPAVGDIGK
ncbi:MAG: Vacuolar protein sorting-associated protein 54 [Geoglossum umbratile]|nr:MAG: Vacuolar protein sorting-associated protein 54 [Geoglossum umbratile]